MFIVALPAIGKREKKRKWVGGQTNACFGPRAVGYSSALKRKDILTRAATLASLEVFRLFELLE